MNDCGFSNDERIRLGTCNTGCDPCRDFNRKLLTHLCEVQMQVMLMKELTSENKLIKILTDKKD